MAKDQDAQHLEHETTLTGVVALASLFSNCVEAFGLVHPSQKWETEEQVLLAGLGIQQARLLIWGDIVGVSSPPRTVTNSAVPKHPSLCYPDLKEPTFFGDRDTRLDETETRVAVEEALNGIVDRSVHMTREEMMEIYGLKPPKKPATGFQPALDTNRLEAFREKYELLQEVAESYAHLNTRRNNSIVMQSWSICNNSHFAKFVSQTQERVDSLINLFDVADRVDRGVRMDIRALGWHLSNDRTRTAHDVSKLRLITQACEDQYPQYAAACTEALAQIEREKVEASISYNPFATPISPPSNDHKPSKNPATTLIHSETPNGNGTAAKKTNGKTTPPSSPAAAPSGKRPSLFARLRSFGKPRTPPQHSHKPVASLNAENADVTDPERSKSDSGPTVARDYGSGIETPTLGSLGLDRVRSKSVGDILDAPVNGGGEEELRLGIQRLRTGDGGEGAEGGDLAGTISRHDQYHGIARTETRDLRQGV